MLELVIGRGAVDHAGAWPAHCSRVAGGDLTERRWSSSHAISWAALALLGFLPMAAVAAPAVVAATVEPTDTTRVVRPAALRTRVYVGMWSTHLRDLREGLFPNSLIGFAYRGYYAATFINSYGDRAIAAGMQRSFYTPRTGPLTTALGYRTGLLTGYDERFLGIGDRLPALPFFQLVGTMDYRMVGVELAYAGIVVSVIVNLRL